MHAWEQIQETIDFIEDHLTEEIEIEKLAGMAALSPFYFQRLFSRLVKSRWPNTSGYGEWPRQPRRCCKRISVFWISHWSWVFHRTRIFPEPLRIPLG